MVTGNGKNRFWIEVKCQYEVYDEEWDAMLLLINMILKQHNSGQFSNVGAFLCDSEEHNMEYQANLIEEAARILGRAGGKVKSEKKTLAARENAKKHRPRIATRVEAAVGGAKAAMGNIQE